MTISVFLRANQSTALTWAQVDTNFTTLANQVNANTAAIASIGGASGGPTGSRPSPPALYQAYFDTTLGYTIWCSQVSPAVWVNASGVSS